MKYLAVLLLLAACSASGPMFSSPDKPELIVYRKSELIGAAGTYTVNVNGVAHCQLHNASFYIDKNAGGSITVSGSKMLAPGTSALTFKADPKKTYYVRMEDNSYSTASVIGAGIVGQLAENGVSSNKGPYIFTLIDPEQAKQELQAMHQDCM